MKRTDGEGLAFRVYRLCSTNVSGRLGCPMFVGLRRFENAQFRVDPTNKDRLVFKMPLCGLGLDSKADLRFATKLMIPNCRPMLHKHVHRPSDLDSQRPQP